MGKDAVEERDRKRGASRGRKPKHAANWMDADGSTLIKAIDAAAASGGALRFGYSRDGGAYAIGVYGDGDPYTDFVGGGEDINEVLEEYTDLFVSLINDRNTSAEAKKRGKKSDELPH